MAFPIGMMDTLTYPFRISIIYTDSIPLFAILFKLLSPLLPEHFQYFGWWGMMCFILQGILTARILRHYTKNTWFIILCSTLALYTPVMIQRIFGHTSLAGQWLILIGLEPLFAYRNYSDFQRLYYHICATAFLSTLTHIYFVLMNGFILLGICLLDLMNHQQWKRSCLMIVTYISISATIVGCLGGFSSGSNYTAGGIGYYSLNLNALINPQGWSCILADLPLATGGQYEGFAYLGMGYILLVFIEIIWCLLVRNRVAILLAQNRLLVISLIFLIVISITFALSNVISLGSFSFTIPIPWIISKLWGIFRSTGRFIWTPIYILNITSFIIIAKLLKDKKRIAIFLIAACLFVQIYDIHEVIQARNERFSMVVHYDSELRNIDFWNRISETKEIKHIVFTDLGVSSDTIYLFSDWIIDCNKTINVFYVAHYPYSREKTCLEESLKSLSLDNLYIFFEDNKNLCEKYDMSYYQIGSFIVGYKNPIAGISSE